MIMMFQNFVKNAKNMRVVIYADILKHNKQWGCNNLVLPTSIQLCICSGERMHLFELLCYCLFDSVLVELSLVRLYFTKCIGTFSTYLANIVFL